MRILVTGAGGMLGSALVPELIRRGHSVVASDLSATPIRLSDGSEVPLGILDVRSLSAVRRAVDSAQPELVMHLAAETMLETCETDPDNAYATNALGTKFVALACERDNIQMVYISTAGVFDGEKPEAYTEFDAPNPINVYGRSKHQGEQYVQTFLPHHFVVRAGWMVGGGRKDHKFVAKILDQIASGATTIHAVGDKFGTPTYAPDFAACLLNLIDSESYGLYHMVCEGFGSRFDVARHILDVLGRTDVALVKVGSEYFHDEYFAPRPMSEMMRNMHLELQGLNTMRPWQVALAEYVTTAFGVRLMMKAESHS